MQSIQSYSNKQVLLGMLVRNRDWLLPRVLEAISQLDYQKKNMGLAFVLNDNHPKDKSKQLLEKFKKKYQTHYKFIIISDYNLGANQAIDSTGFLYTPTSTTGNPKTRAHLCANLAILRNYLLTLTRENEYLFSVDSDIILESHTLEELLSVNKDIVSALIFNDWRMYKSSYNSLEGRHINCMKQKAGKPYIFDFIRDYRTDAPFPVDLTGACYLIKKRVIDADIKYHTYGLSVGEDNGFCYDAKAKGFEIWCNPRTMPLHIMSKHWKNLRSNIFTGVVPKPVSKPENTKVEITSYTPPAKPIIQKCAKKNGRVIWYPMTVRFRWMLQRPQHLLNQFAKEGYAAYFGDSSISPDQINGITVCDNFPHVSPNLRIIPTSRVIKEKQITYISWPVNGEHAKKLRENGVDTFIWYDVVDHDEVFHLSNTERYKELKQWLLENADLITASAINLVEDVKKVRSDVIYVPNGADTDTFLNAHYPQPVPDEFRNIDKPIVGFYGAVANWIDHTMIEAAIKAYPEYHFVVIGPNYSATWKCLEKYPNYTRVLHVPFPKLPRYLHYFNICIAPFKFNAISKACSPIKFFEYLSSGKPVVATNIDELKKHKEYIYLAKDSAEFVKHIKTAVMEHDFKKRVQRVQAAYEFSWENLYKSMTAKIEKWWKKSK